VPLCILQASRLVTVPLASLDYGNLSPLGDKSCLLVSGFLFGSQPKKPKLLICFICPRTTVISHVLRLANKVLHPYGE